MCGRVQIDKQAVKRRWRKKEVSFCSFLEEQFAVKFYFILLFIHFVLRFVFLWLNFKGFGLFSGCFTIQGHFPLWFSPVFLLEFLLLIAPESRVI